MSNTDEAKAGDKRVLIHTVLAAIWGVQALGAVISLFLALTHHIEPTQYFLLSVGYVSLASIYANVVTHVSAREGAKAAVIGATNPK